MARRCSGAARVIVTRIELVDFRNYQSAVFDFHPGITAVVGLNGQGKTNLAEAMAYLASLDSFRGAPGDALIRVGADAAVVRATVRQADEREVLVELELNRSGRNRVQVNKQRLGRSRDLLGVMRVTVFSPDDLELVKGGPGERRRFMDDTLVALALKYDSMRLELDRVLKQRNTLLKQAAGRLDVEAEVTLDVWDAKFAELGDQFGHARAVLVARLSPMVAEAYEQLADRPTPVELRYEPTWRG
ncbi:MAG TPA: DNA replication and repair protein RecF, partial [Acidimicrobiaceae bacterium]|nr:DNA replication and repair protein RecF [Acidimicrobiaceae bacterium]